MFLSLQRDLISQDNFAHVGSDEIVSKTRKFLQYYHLSSLFAHLHHLFFFQPGDNSFGDKAVRRGFIRKVYAILMCQVSGRTWKRIDQERHYHAFLRFYKMSLQLTDPAVNFQLTLTGVIIATFMFVGNCSDPVSQMNPDHINIF